jgi:hypothetical protein
MKGQTKPASDANCYLTEQDKLSIAQLFWGVAKCGQGVTREEVLAIIDNYIHIQEDEWARVECCSEKALHGLLSQNSNMIKLIVAGYLDPVQSEKATVDTRDAVFCKLDGFVKIC